MRKQVSGRKDRKEKRGPASTKRNPQAMPSKRPFKRASEGSADTARFKKEKGESETKAYRGKDVPSKNAPAFKRSYKKIATESFGTAEENHGEDRPYKKSFKENRASGSTYKKTGSFSRKYDKANKIEGEESPFQKKEFSRNSKPFKRKDLSFKPKNTHRSRASAPKPKKEGEEHLIRLNRYIANTGICSRREADELISAGAVMVNGKVITEMGYKVSPEDEVRYGGETIRKERPVYLILNKPKDFITTTDDPQSRKTVMGLVQDACRERIYPVGRLDRDTTGLLLFTNDGELTKKLTHPAYEIKKIYHVELDKSVKQSDLKKISEGFELEDGFIKADEVSYVGASKNEIGIELHSGKNRIVRRIFESMEYRVKKLDRVYFAGLTKKDLPRGRWRFLTEMEVNMLRMLTGKKKKYEIID